jgi:hypothetical protein
MTRHDLCHPSAARQQASLCLESSIVSCRLLRCTLYTVFCLSLCVTSSHRRIVASSRVAAIWSSRFLVPRSLLFLASFLSSLLCALRSTSHGHTTAPTRDTIRTVRSLSCFVCLLLYNRAPQIEPLGFANARSDWHFVCYSYRWRTCS